MARAKPVRDEWMCGYAAALASVCRLYCQQSMVDGVIKADGLSFAKFKGAGVEDFDLDEIRNAVGMRPRNRRTRKCE